MARSYTVDIQQLGEGKHWATLTEAHEQALREDPSEHSASPRQSKPQPERTLTSQLR